MEHADFGLGATLVGLCRNQIFLRRNLLLKKPLLPLDVGLCEIQRAPALSCIQLWLSPSSVLSRSASGLPAPKELPTEAYTSTTLPAHARRDVEDAILVVGNIGGHPNHRGNGLKIYRFDLDPGVL